MHQFVSSVILPVEKESKVKSPISKTQEESSERINYSLRKLQKSPSWHQHFPSRSSHPSLPAIPRSQYQSQTTTTHTIMPTIRLAASASRQINAVVVSAGLMQKTVKARIGVQKMNKFIGKVHSPSPSLPPTPTPGNSPTPLCNLPSRTSLTFSLPLRNSTLQPMFSSTTPTPPCAPGT